MPGPYIDPFIRFDTSTIPFPASPMGTNIFDSHAVACNAGVWTELCAGIGFNTKFVSCTFQTVAGGAIGLGLGAAGLEIEILDVTCPANSFGFVVNAPLIITANTRISLNPAANCTAELHLFY